MSDNFVVPTESEIMTTMENVIERDQYVKDMSVVIVSVIEAGASMPFKRWLGKTYYICVEESYSSWVFEYDAPWMVIRSDGTAGVLYQNDYYPAISTLGIILSFFISVPSVFSSNTNFDFTSFIMGIIISLIPLYFYRRFVKYGKTVIDKKFPRHIKALYHEINKLDRI